MGKFLRWLQRCIQHWTKPADFWLSFRPTSFNCCLLDEHNIRGGLGSGCSHNAMIPVLEINRKNRMTSHPVLSISDSIIQLLYKSNSQLCKAPTLCRLGYRPEWE